MEESLCCKTPSTIKETEVFETDHIELAAGLRRGELLGLKWEDIHLEQGSLRVQRQVCRTDGEIVEAPLKTKNACRNLPPNVKFKTKIFIRYF